MYKCQITGALSQPGDKLHKVVVATRPQVYYKMVKNEETLKWERVQCSTGWEIVKELNCSAAGKAMWESMTPEDRQIWLTTRH